MFEEEEKLFISIMGVFCSWCDSSFGWYWLRLILRRSNVLFLGKEYWTVGNHIFCRILCRVQFLNILICCKGILIWMHWRPLTKAMVHLIWLNFPLSDAHNLSNIQIHGIEQDSQISLSHCVQIFTQSVFVTYLGTLSVSVLPKGQATRMYVFCICFVIPFSKRYDKLF